MFQLNTEDLKSRSRFEAASIALPRYDAAAVRKKTVEHPSWVHFGAGNIFRGFLASAQQILLNKGLVDRGIVAAESFDFQIIDNVYKPYDNLSLLVTMHSDGSYDKEVVASVAEGLKADYKSADFERLQEIFADPALQMVSFTITEKGYALTDMTGKPLRVAEEDIAGGPNAPRHTMSIAASLLYERFKAGGAPIAMVSMDNCAQNGKKLKEGVFAIARGWKERGFASEDFLAWLADESRVTFPWSMIDKITPHPSEKVKESLEELGIIGMDISRTNTGTLIAPFVNTEETGYLVIEDSFPAGRPPLEEAGVYFTDRVTVEKAEKMKVGTCLNPLHTALAVFGCLLGYTAIYKEMKDTELVALIKNIAEEGLPVAADPGFLSPRKFVEEVLTVRFPNPAIPDTPQRIAADTSQKIPVRYGGTLTRYAESEELSADSLKYIPLVFAGWCRYLLGVDDALEEMEISPDPMLPELKELLAGVEAGKPETFTDQLRPILSNKAVFGIDLYAEGLGERTEKYFREMLAGKGAVRSTLKKYL